MLKNKVNIFVNRLKFSIGVTLHPPLIIENLLFYDIELLFFTSNRVTLKVPSGESRPLYNYDSSKNLTLRISGIPGIPSNKYIFCSV